MRSRLTYANVAATLALVFSMSGGALAASHYLISSTKQISPKVLEKLKGATGAVGPKGATGAAGAAGAAGPPGVTGKEGPQGKEGAQGKDGSPGEEGAQGEEGPQGEEGAQGEEGERGPSDVWQRGDGSSAGSAPPLTVSLPAGSYLVSAKTAVHAGTGSSACFLKGGSGEDNAYGSTEASGITQTTIENLMTTTLSKPEVVELKCSGSGTFGFAKLTAIQVSTIH